ncbi:MAG: hypothetical protein LQ352_007286 [Teloschistes flavicans]|nr:MAG: hypothetical protein LQ352_007286 [Teloschistes flavicans]
MTIIVGKRKRRKDVEANHPLGSPKAHHADEQLQSLLRQHFETKFEPLVSLEPMTAPSPSYQEDFNTEDDDTDWTGFSGDGDGVSTVVVDHHGLDPNKTDISREEVKFFMSARPPVQPNGPPASAKRKTMMPIDTEEAATDAANLQKDLALQRLLKESHLLDPSSASAPSGQNRHKALDIRQQALGSKKTVFSQQKMPLAQRKGILAKAVERDESRRREAKENGIILEKAVKPKVREPQRQRGIGAPSVGKFSHGMLTLSKKDVASIVGPRKRSKRR